MTKRYADRDTQRVQVLAPIASLEHRKFVRRDFRTTTRCRSWLGLWHTLALVVAAFLLPMRSLALSAAVEDHTTLRACFERPRGCFAHTAASALSSAVGDETSPVLAQQPNEIPTREDPMAKSTLVVELWGITVA